MRFCCGRCGRNLGTRSRGCRAWHRVVRRSKYVEARSAGGCSEPPAIVGLVCPYAARACRSEEHTSELQSLMRISYDVFCLKKKKPIYTVQNTARHKSQRHNDNSFNYYL